MGFITHKKKNKPFDGDFAICSVDLSEGFATFCGPERYINFFAKKAKK
jgi:hypothetical protein